MGIALVIMGGLSLISVFAIIGDYLTKRRAGGSPEDRRIVTDLAKRIDALEQQVQARDARIEQLENDVSFATRLIEDKHK
jgi:hypothetical protein